MLVFLGLLVTCTLSVADHGFHNSGSGFHQHVQSPFRQHTQFHSSNVHNQFQFNPTANAPVRPEDAAAQRRQIQQLQQLVQEQHFRIMNVQPRLPGGPMDEVVAHIRHNLPNPNVFNPVDSQRQRQQIEDLIRIVEQQKRQLRVKRSVGLTFPEEVREADALALADQLNKLNELIAERDEMIARAGLEVEAEEGFLDFGSAERVSSGYGASVEPARAEYIAPSEPARAEYIAPSEPARAEYIAPSEPARAEYIAPSEPARAEYIAPSEPARAEYIAPSEPARAEYIAPSEPARAEYIAPSEPARAEYIAPSEPARAEYSLPRSEYSASSIGDIDLRQSLETFTSGELRIPTSSYGGQIRDEDALALAEQRRQLDELIAMNRNLHGA